MSFVVPSLGEGSAPPAVELCTATVADYINETQRLLMGSQGQILNVAAEEVDASETAITMTHALDGIAPRKVIAINDELMYVVSIDTATKVVTVLRGHRGTTSAIHANGSVVEVSPRYPKPFIRNALRDEIKSWPESVFSVGVYDLSLSGTVYGYDLPIGDFHRIIDVWLSPASPASEKDWTRIPYTVRKQVPTGDFASGNSITFEGTWTPSRTVRVLYAKAFDVSSMDDAVACSTIGLSPSMSDIPPLGAAWRLVQHNEVKRLDRQSQGEPRRAEEVPSGAASGTASMFKTRRDERLNDEKARLLGLYGLRWG